MTTIESSALSERLRQTTADAAAEALFEAVLSGAIAPGAPLRLQQLADLLGISVMPVREAVHKLDALGLVESRPHRGAWLRPLTRDDLLDTYFARVNLEVLAVREAARRFTAEDTSAARNALTEQQRLKEHGDQVAARLAHERFHFALYRAAGSSWLMRSILPAWRNAERYRVLSMRSGASDPELRHEEHEELLRALTARDEAGAVECLLRHLQSSIRAGLAVVTPPAASTNSRWPTDVTARELLGMHVPLTM